MFTNDIELDTLRHISFYLAKRIRAYYSVISTKDFISKILWVPPMSLVNMFDVMHTDKVDKNCNIINFRA